MTAPNNPRGDTSPDETPPFAHTDPTFHHGVRAPGLAECMRPVPRSRMTAWRRSRLSPSKMGPVELSPLDAPAVPPAAPSMGRSGQAPSTPARFQASRCPCREPKPFCRISRFLLLNALGVSGRRVPLAERRTSKCCRLHENGRRTGMFTKRKPALAVLRLASASSFVAARPRRWQFV